MAEDVRFIVVTLPDADKFTLQIHAAVAEKEGENISENTKRALAQSKKKLGMAKKSKAEQRRIRALAMAAKERALAERSKIQRPHIEFALKDGASLRAAAATLKELNVPSPFGARWHASSVLKVARRLGLR
jgi:DNA invertase Pin-like site-specific DNA recombinase